PFTNGCEAPYRARTHLPRLANGILHAEATVSLAPPLGPAVLRVHGACADGRRRAGRLVSRQLGIELRQPRLAQLRAEPRDAAEPERDAGPDLGIGLCRGGHRRRVFLASPVPDRDVWRLPRRGAVRRRL